MKQISKTTVNQIKTKTENNTGIENISELTDLSNQNILTNRINSIIKSDNNINNIKEKINCVEKEKRPNSLTQIGAKTKTSARHKDDFYATPEIAITSFLETGFKIKTNLVWEVACGDGAISNPLKRMGYHVISTDLVDRKYGLQLDFLKFHTKRGFTGTILTNPPFSIASKIITHALDCICDGGQVIMLLKIQFLEGKERRVFLNKYNPKYVYTSSSRISCAINGDFIALKSKNKSAMLLAWFVWEKGFKGDTILRWFN